MPFWCACPSLIGKPDECPDIPPEPHGSRLIESDGTVVGISSNNSAMSVQQIRQHYRQIRRSLGLKQQQQYAYQLLHNINDAIGFRFHKKIGSYISTQSEISLNPWITSTKRQHIYLPKLYETIHPRLRFAPLNQETDWTRNRFNILEPDVHWGDTISARQLDIVLIPLVAFDRQGNRMGMGGGYYDRSLAFRHHRRHWKKPQLIGVAYSCQEYSSLPVNSWDIGMDLIITEKEIITPL